jgi:dTDP-4-dehydrorhamnose 3,5-epimerase
MSMKYSHGQQHVQTVEPDGRLLAAGIDGVIVRPAVAQVDERGLLCEIWREDWGVGPMTNPQTYLFTLRPGIRKGWVMHKRQYDRMFLVAGVIQVALYDARRHSPTFRQRQDVFVSVEARKLIVIPPFVVHAVVNIGQGDAVVVNTPSEMYNHRQPDKFAWDEPLETPPDVVFD